MECWESKGLEHIISQVEVILKIDDHTLNITRAKFVYICVDINLLRSLK